MIVLVGAGLTLGAVGWWWGETAESRALRALPQSERLGLYHRTLENLHAICEPVPGRSFREFCRAQAALILELPECDDACAEIARRHLSLPRL